MRRLLTFFIDNPLLPRLINLTVIAAGIACAFLLRRDVLPPASYDTISVSTDYPGASAEEVETLVTNGLERRVREANGIRKLVSRSEEGRSSIVVQVDPESTTQDKALSEVRSAVDRFQSMLPEGCERPEVRADDSTQQPILEVHLMGDSPLILNTAAKRLKQELELDPGVARVNVHGLSDPQFKVETSAATLAKYQVTLLEMAGAIKKRNTLVPGGAIEGDIERSVRTTGRLTDAKSIGETVLRANEAGGLLRVSDVAKVVEGQEQSRLVVRTGGHRSVSLVVLKRAQADAIALVNSVRAKTEELKPVLGPVRIEFVNDLSQFITRKLSILGSNFSEGLLLLLLILILFLPWRLASIVATGLPFAILGTLILFYFGGYTLNLISLIGLIVISGMLIDDAIVISDSCLRELKTGASPRDAAIEGTIKVWRSVAASSFVTILAFLPILFMGGETGKFARELPLAVVLALGLSLFRAFFLLPVDFMTWIRRDQSNAKWKGMDRLWDSYVVAWYTSVLTQALRHRGKVLFATALLCVGTAWFAVEKMSFVLFPSNDMELFVVQAGTKAGTSLVGTEKAILSIEAALAKLPKTELKQFVTTVGLQTAEDLLPRAGSEVAEIFVYLTPPETRTRTNEAIIASLAADIGRPQGLERVRFVRIGPMQATGKPIQFGITASDYASLALPVAREIEAQLRSIPGVLDVTDNYVAGRDKFTLEVDAAAAAAAGVSVEEVGNTVRAAYSGLAPTKIWWNGEEIDIRVGLNDEDRADRGVLDRLSVSNLLGVQVPLAKLGRITSSRELLERSHSQGRKELVVTADVNPAVTDPLSATRAMEPFLKALALKHPSVSVAVAGDAADTEAGLASLLITFGLSLLGVFLLLVLLYQKFSHALLTFVSIPLGFVAATWAFTLHGKPFTFLGMMGMIALCGVIVNHSVIFLDFIRQFRANGEDRWNSLYLTGKQRLRPIFLTTATTVVGVLPTAYGIGGADSFVTYIALALSWGLGVGALLTLFVIPAGVAVLDDLAEAKVRLPRFKWGYREKPVVVPTGT